MTRSTKKLIEEYRPEIFAGGYPRDDGTITFYQRISRLLRSDMVVLDLGAGRGAHYLTTNNSLGSQLSRLNGKVGRLIGVDVDSAIKQHPALDEAHVINTGQVLPFSDESFDLILSDWVLEHIENPTFFVAEIRRVLRPGGWFCARTPSKWGFIALAARLIPKRLHSTVLNWAQGNRNTADVFPKFYRMNTLHALDRHFNSAYWLNCTYPHNPTPAYAGNSKLLFRILDFYQNIPLQNLKTTLLVFMKKKE